ncbi:hypothetical protein SynA1825c_00368 [Synechococcus sp. A18-25c]|uniref:hypothetical protein n=1 Tax=Synechococcus sp. A18-25c TaxID=1866938 RepID=UPI001644237A|nr:hypothetical protein [Synechococcus sp. A18-25c]QNJ18704.1 hypothetical protein SynA1825c_00368 [Synechococcus sp. A18-25c]
MSQLSIKLSDKADALIAQLQKEIFNRRRKKVTAAGVVESLVESGARSQSDKRFATSWVNLIKDIEKAAKLANAHGSKPSSLTDEEWVMVLSHRNRQAAAKPARQSAAKQRTAITKSAAKAATSRKTAAKTTAAKTTAARATRKAAKTSTSKVAAAKSAPAKTTSAKTTASVASAGKSRPARRARKATKSASVGSAAGRMAKAAAQLASANGFSSPARS